MRSVACGVAALLLAAGVAEGAEAHRLLAPDPAQRPHLMFYAGGDLWHTGEFLHGGLLWSPGGLFNEGFTLKLLAGVGTYRYLAGGPGGVEVTGFTTLGSVMPGWRFKAGKFEATVYAGLDMQTHKLTPDDLSNRMRGTQVGMRAGADLWYEPAPSLMLAANVSASTIGPNYWARVAGGVRAFDLLWVGPELQGLSGPTHHQFRAGVHATALRTRLFEWSAGFGFVIDSDRRRGLYGRIGVLARH
jgi:hypothetical protein